MIHLQHGRSSVRSYEKNHYQNGGDFVDLSDDDALADMSGGSVTTPGLIRLPVCSPEQAYRTWNKGESTNNDPMYPCNIAKGKDLCQSSSFEDQTSDASPSVADCLQVIKKIQGDSISDFTVGISEHRELGSDTCKFTVHSIRGADGNVTFYVGLQDIIDIIRDAISKFGGGGRIGAKGIVDCAGDVHDTTMEWEIHV